MKKKEDKLPKKKKNKRYSRNNLFAKKQILQYDYNRFLV